MIKIFRIKIKTESDKLIEQIENAYENNQKIQFHILQFKNKTMQKYVEDNEERFKGHVEFKSKFEIMQEKAIQLRLYGYQMQMSVSEEDLKKTQIIFDFRNKEKAE